MLHSFSVLACPAVFKRSIRCLVCGLSFTYVPNAAHIFSKHMNKRRPMKKVPWTITVKVIFSSTFAYSSAILSETSYILLLRWNAGLLDDSVLASDLEWRTTDLHVVQSQVCNLHSTLLHWIVAYNDIVMMCRSRDSHCTSSLGSFWWIYSIDRPLYTKPTDLERQSAVRLLLSTPTAATKYYYPSREANRFFIEI